ncbi:MAG: arylsulfatase A-like enzyme/lysophospholipase L1-like esterase [Candidatus Promineifilaceae bacterium]|jgi:arylsulfatase A-like enzyme/lysophospholipase L1-like esterase
MIRTFSAAAVLAVLATCVSASLAAEKPRPNIVFFLIDDLGWADVGCYGSTFYETPNIDQLAAQGMRFSDAYAVNPVCTPTRASIMTGKYPSRIKMTNFGGHRGPSGAAYKLLGPDAIGSLPLPETTIAEALKAGGYRTAHIGKWHLQSHSQKDKANFPQAQGFDVNIAGHNAGQPGSYFFPYKSKQHAWSNVPDLDEGKPGEYLTDRLTDEAIAFIGSNNSDQPFFLNMWYYSVHTPIMGKKDKMAKYQEKAKKMGLTDPDQGVREYDSWHHARQDNASYAAMVESMDENVGRVLDALKAKGLEQNTIVIFMSDNGGLSTGGGKRMPTSNLPLRAGKAWIYEGGIREPMIIKWPGVTAPGSVCAEPVISTDFYPTMLDMAGLPRLLMQHVDGVSLSPVLKDASASLGREAIYFHYPHYHSVNSMGPSGAIRVGDYKLVERFENMKVELFNLRDDIGELHDLSKTKPVLTQKLKTMLHEWREESGALMPTQNPNYTAETFFTPKQDRDGLKKNTDLKDGLPNVLLVGDSISIGYTKPVMAMLKDVANVQRVNTNCGDTDKGLAMLTRWLGSTQWDVIHFNWGLHDLCYRHADSKTQGNRDKVKGSISVPLDQYEKNLEALVLKLKETDAALIWASTTMVPDGEAGRVLGDDAKYNAVAAKIMQKHDIAINDLHALSMAFAGKYSAPGNVHFNKDGSARLAEQVADSIRFVVEAE